jgi:hypothetical protein
MGFLPLKTVRTEKEAVLQKAYNEKLIIFSLHVHSTVHLLKLLTNPTGLPGLSL